MVGPTPAVRSRRFHQLDAATAYAVWRLRAEVFVVEQECAYLDLDGRDLEPTTRHLTLHVSGPDGDVLAGYLRILEDGAALRIGRVVLDRAYRGRGLAEVMMRAALEETLARTVVLGAQAPLAPWYATFGFEVDGPGYLEDGIAHLPMRRQ